MKHLLIVQLIKEGIHIGYEESKHRPFDSGPFAGIVPLKMDFDVVSVDSGVRGIFRILKRQSKSKTANIESDRRFHILRWQHGMNLLEHGF